MRRVVATMAVLVVACQGLKNIPFMFAGQGAGKFQTGRVVDAGGRSNNDLLVSIQNASGIASTVFGLQSLCKGPII